MVRYIDITLVLVARRYDTTLDLIRRYQAIRRLYCIVVYDATYDGNRSRYCTCLQRLSMEIVHDTVLSRDKRYY